MANSDFLKNLKNAVETGEFNSDAAKKINEINNLADTKTASESEQALNKRLESVGVKILSEDDVELNSQYEQKMEEIKKQDAANKVLATLIEIEDMVKASIEDMLSHVIELEDEFSKEFETKNPIYGDLSQKIEQIKTKYKQ
jgi:predicted SprT family Zn-dependent metalloprotease